MVFLFGESFLDKTHLSKYKTVCAHFTQKLLQSKRFWKKYIQDQIKSNLRFLSGLTYTPPPIFWAAKSFKM